MRVLAASFPDAASARAARSRLITAFGLDRNHIGVEPLAPTRDAREGSGSILAGRFQDAVVPEARAVVEACGGTLVIDVDGEGRNA